MEVSDVLKTFYVWGMGISFAVTPCVLSQLGNANADATSRFNISYDSNKTRETCLHIGYFIHSGVFMCFYKNVYGYMKIFNLW